ncbi:gas vesicle protein [Endozoicomonas sp. SM1973]|uniref:Gas vesicle protein n=1 Tax=Spartinivicinus marinus TaxID=2994442 RepID=A0A853HW76_9GAMM|nr:gas vesicle protein [Spartinivicinus marinus]MCX4028914.1 gas vesicle protein [Spartinivicinus marinus]NYZ65503.1 gas vesicle protein [Spartinivicinus marinus]
MTIDNLLEQEEGQTPLLIEDAERLTLCETLDRVLNKGAVVVGEVTLSVANIDLIHVSLQLVLSSIETAMKHQIGRGSTNE